MPTSSQPEKWREIFQPSKMSGTFLILLKRNTKKLDICFFPRIINVNRMTVLSITTRKILLKMDSSIRHWTDSSLRIWWKNRANLRSGKRNTTFLYPSQPKENGTQTCLSRKIKIVLFRWERLEKIQDFMSCKSIIVLIYLMRLREKPYQLNRKRRITSWCLTQPKSIKLREKLHSRKAPLLPNLNMWP